MESKIWIVSGIAILLMLTVYIFVLSKHKAPMPLGFGDSASHADILDPEQQRTKLEEVAQLAAQQARATKKFNTENSIA